MSFYTPDEFYRVKIKNYSHSNSYSILILNTAVSFLLLNTPIRMKACWVHGQTGEIF